MLNTYQFDWNRDIKGACFTLGLRKRVTNNHGGELPLSIKP